jgi:hypothetical protein
MRVNGRMTFSTEKVLKLGLIKADMRVTTLTEESMVLAVTSGMMAASIQETGEKTKSVELEYTLGSTVEDTRVNG